MLMLQAEAQLEQCYRRDGNTIIANCDSYIYLGGNDIETANAIARCAVGKYSLHAGRDELHLPARSKAG